MVIGILRVFVFNNKESNEPDYNDDEKSNKEGEERQEHDTREITITNQVF
jgi:hypothetical protein